MIYTLVSLPTFLSFPALEQFHLGSEDSKISCSLSSRQTCPRLDYLSYGLDEQRSVANRKSRFRKDVV
jgi:hypothetical protein